MPETWHDLRALVRNPREGSSLHKALDPEWDVTPQLLFVRDIAFLLEWMRWARWDGNETRRPEPRLLTEIEREAMRASKPKGADQMTPDDMLAALGLPPRREEVPDGR